MTFKLKYRIALLAIVSTALPVLAISFLTRYKEDVISSLMKQKIDVLIADNVSHIAKDVYGMCEAADKLLQERLDSDMNVAMRLFLASGGLSISSGETVKWRATDQFSGTARELELPKAFHGDVWLGQNFDKSKPTPFIDEVKALTGVTCTVFQRMNPAGDMLRVATNVEKSDGTRAIGTFIPAANPDGSPNQVVSAIMAGKSYRGRAFVVNDWYLTDYEPLKDKSGEIIGCLYVGLRLNALKTVGEMIKGTKVGRSGYIAILGGKEAQRGRYVVSKGGERDGENIIDSLDAKGELFIKRMVDTAVKLKPEALAIQRYLWKNPDDPEPREKMAALKYFEPWDWVIVSSTYADDYREINESVESVMHELFDSVLALGLAVLLLAACVALIIGSKIGSPVEKASSMASLIADGELGAASDRLRLLSRAVSENGEVKESALSHDETGALVRSIAAMTRSLNALVGQAQRSIIQLASSATEIAASAKEQEAVVNEFGASTNEIVASSKEISATSQHLVSSMKDVAEVAERTSSLASSGRSGLGEMESMMGRLASATESISAKLSVINEKANSINSVVAAITKVADQTNLLSLNAAIEAEKAGEFGKGFSVVAREVRRLADQTAVATLDISRTVKEMQSAVSSGVMEMDKFSDEVRRGVKETDGISGQLAKIIEEAQSLPPVFNNVIEGMQQQASGAQQISEAISQLSDAVRQTSESLREFNQAVSQLNAATQGLQKEVSFFKVK